MGRRGASLQLIMAGSKSYIPTCIFTKAWFHIFNRNSIPIVISGDGISIKILSILLVSKKVQRDAVEVLNVITFLNVIKSKM